MIRRFWGGSGSGCEAFGTIVETLKGGSVIVKAFLSVIGISAIRVGPEQLPTPPVIW
jgi:hypothetical protein